MEKKTVIHFDTSKMEVEVTLKVTCRLDQLTALLDMVKNVEVTSAVDIKPTFADELLKRTKKNR